MTLILCLAVLVVSALLTGAVRGYALRKQLLDIPNERSSHSVPTPRGGGVGLVAAFILGLGSAVWLGLLPAWDAAVLAVPGLAVASIGFADDHGHIAARWRLLAHFGAASVGLALLHSWPIVPITSHFHLSERWLAIPLAVGLVWLLNLYNFMDGIDGIAGTQAVTVCLGFALLSYLFATPADTVLALLLGAASGGFLCWNLPPARIFMGDAGSGFLGIAIGFLWLKIAAHKPECFWAGFVLMGVFIIDATWTLAVRLKNKQRIYEAHRSHGYQQAAIWLGSHGKVTATVALINLAWLLPLSWCIAAGAIPAAWGVGIAAAPLVIAAWLLGAGLQGSPPRFHGNGRSD